jgi:hypothetical protein
MKKKQTSLSDLVDEAVLSEPLNTFTSNALAISFLLEMTSEHISEREHELTQNLDKAAEDKKYQETELQQDKDRLRELSKMRSQIESKERPKELGQLIRRTRTLITERKTFIKELGSHMDTTLRPLLDIYQKQKAVLVPMVFVYLVTIWDAFVLDTIRRILRVHPQLITANRDAKTGVSKAFLWDAPSIEDVRNHLVEEMVQDLDYDREKLLKCFADYWGIDWERSGIPLDELVEIRARRDIWVHNKGIVNRHYLDMVGEHASFKEGQVAEIDAQYINACLDKLKRLASFIHGIAYMKHYTKTDAG